MRFGTYYFFQAPPSLSHPEVVQREMEQMAWTEELGFDSIWLTEHHFIEYGLSVSPALLAAAAAMRTQRVRIGLAAAILPFHDPVRLAEELAMVDILSGGRLDVGVGRGNRPVEFEGYRVPQIENRERFEEALEIMVRAWTKERFAFEGRHFTIPEIRVIPKPLQQPHPPLYVVCVSPDTIEATALRGLPMLNSILRGPIDPLVQQRDTYVKACRKAGRSETEIAGLLGRWGVSRHIYVAATDAQAQAEAKDAEMWYQEALRRFLIPEDIERVHPLLQPGFRAAAERLAHITWEQLVAETLAVGSPDTVADKLAEMRDLGVGEVLCWMNFGGLPQAQVRRSMELFSREVLPRFR
ncbi:MAG TPA: LLM class flavin-dependent oxidoreductase [Methylomirabilota bacterium]